MIALATRPPSSISTKPRPLSFRVRKRGNAWHVTEHTSGAVGGVFVSANAAVAFALEEYRRVPGSRIVVLDSDAHEL